MKKIVLIMFLSIVIFCLSFMPQKATTNNVFETGKIEPFQILDNDPHFNNILEQEMLKKYPDFIVEDAIKTSKTYNVLDTDLYVEMYSNLLANYLGVYIDCKNLLNYNLGCQIDYNYQDKNIYTLDKNKKTVALTFDDGPGDYNREIVELLTKNKANATFFVLGNKINQDNKENLLYAIKMGNEIGSHTYSHKILTRLTKSSLDNEFNLSKEAIKNYLNYDLKLVRPPYGIINEQIKNSYDFTYILWDIDTLDWKYRSANSVSNKVIGHVNDGDIILMHETYYSSYKALEKILPELYQKGFQVTTVSNLASLKNQTLNFHESYSSFK